MKNRMIRVSVVTGILLVFYFSFFTKEVKDLPVQQYLPASTANAFDSDTIFHRNGYVVIGNPAEIVLIQQKDSLDLKYKDYIVFARYKEEMLLVKKSDSGSMEVYKKYESQHKFEAFQVTVYEGKLAAPDFSTNPDAKRFVTRITEGCKEGVNFAGYYTLIFWGCGTECQMGVVVDRKTGTIYDGFQASLGAKYEKNSKLLFKNYYLLDEEGYFPLNYPAKVSAEIWENQQWTILD